MNPGQPDTTIVRRHLLALDEAVQHLRRHAGLRGIAGFRNVLVHGYLGVSLARLHQLLNLGLEDFAGFAQFVEDYIRRA
jgi:uncharacterized protein YutE (UPF0331/DUF86 family)